MQINNEFQKNMNISQVFELIWKRKNVSRSEIAKDLGLYKSTVSNVCDFMLDKKLILEGELGGTTLKGGRKPVNLSINPEYGVFIGIEIQEDNYFISILKFNGELFYKNNGNIEEFCDENEKNLKNIILNLINYLQKNILQNRKIISASFAVPGIIDSNSGKIIKSVPFDLKNYDFNNEISSLFDFPCLIENDAKCGSWFIKFNKNEKDFMCVLAKNHKQKGYGIGLSFVVNGDIVKGHNFAAGEYVSLSWRNENDEQTGLSETIIKTINDDDNSFKEWIKDLFSTLTIVVPVFDSNKIYFYGFPEEKIDFIKQIINSEVKQFMEIVNKSGTELEFLKQDNYAIATGSIFMFIKELFKIPQTQNFCGKEMSWGEI